MGITVNLAEHLERHLGEIEVGWPEDSEGNQLPFEIVRFKSGSTLTGTAFATLGLSRHELHSSESGAIIRQELLLIVPDHLAGLPVPAILQQVGLAALDSGHIYLRGDVIGPYGSLFPDTSMEALYVARPVYFPDEFGVCAESEYDVYIAWLIPITLSEARHVATHGWLSFETHLAEADPNLVDVRRESIFL